MVPAQPRQVSLGSLDWMIDGCLEAVIIMEIQSRVDRIIQNSLSSTSVARCLSFDGLRE